LHIIYILAIIDVTKRKSHLNMANKTKRERFTEVAGSRVQMVIDRIENLSKCANRRNYEFTQGDIDKMFKAISDKLKISKMKFEAELNSNQRERKTFKF